MIALSPFDTQWLWCVDCVCCLCCVIWFRGFPSLFRHLINYRGVSVERLFSFQFQICLSLERRGVESFRGLWHSMNINTFPPNLESSISILIGGQKKKNIRQLNISSWTTLTLNTSWAVPPYGRNIVLQHHTACQQNTIKAVILAPFRNIQQ